MTIQIELGKGALILAEMQEFASFAPQTQNYIRRSLDVAFAPETAIERWAGSDDEADSIRAQMHLYRLLPVIRGSIPVGDVLAAADTFLFALIAVSIFDVSGGELSSFPHYRFLYERLVGGEVRPWLPSALAAAAALPHVIAHRRQELLMSMSGTLNDRWSSRQPAFYPAWFAN